MRRRKRWIGRLLPIAIVLSLSAPSEARVPAAARVTAASALATSPLVINEIMANPAAVSDAKGEWFELYNPGASAVDIQHYHIASQYDAGFTITKSLIVPAGGYVVLAKVASPTANGGATVDYAYGSAINLLNGSDWLAIRDAKNATVDSVAWRSTTSGKSWSLKNPSVAHAAVGNPVWQLATSKFGAGDFGTPRARNDGFVGTPVAELVVRVLDVGQGDANYISNGTSKVIIDGGPNPARFGLLLDSLGLNNSTINVVVLSHEHSDHLAGLQELFKTSRNITINYFFENKDAYTSAGIARLRDSINSRVGRGQLIYRDTDDPCANGKPICDISLNGGAKMHMLRPMPSDSNPNNRSAVVKLIGPDSASFSMWFAGDAEQQAIGWFLGAAGYATNPGMHVTVLKADHHGSCNGVTNAYLNAIKPELVTASVGAVNTYGHMHNQAKALYTAHSTPWYRTDGNGTIVFRTPGTLGGGYTVAVVKGSKNMSGQSDATSTQTECKPIP
ncbi:MAG: lamin tail domain-containing protein [Gemmatimonadaceae bacterium]